MSDDYLWVQLLPFAIWLVIILIPAISICKRVGKTPWWAVLSVIPPFLGLIPGFVENLALPEGLTFPILGMEPRLPWSCRATARGGAG